MGKVKTSKVPNNIHIPNGGSHFMLEALTCFFVSLDIFLSAILKSLGSTKDKHLE